MAYEMVMPYHLHMPSYFLETFTEYPYIEGAHSVYYNRFISSATAPFPLYLLFAVLNL